MNGKCFFTLHLTLVLIIPLQIFARFLVLLLHPEAAAHLRFPDRESKKIFQIIMNLVSVYHHHEANCQLNQTRLSVNEKIRQIFRAV